MDLLRKTGREVESMALHVTSLISIPIPFPALSERKNVDCVGGISILVVGDDAREVGRAVFEQIEQIHEIEQIHRQSTATTQWELPYTGKQ